MQLLLQIIPAWISRFPGVLSFALPKNSPYKPFLDYAVIKLRETGPWILLKSRYEEDIPICRSPPKGTPLGMTKIFTLFLLVGIGACVGLLFLMLELLWRPKKSSGKPSVQQLHPFFIGAAVDSVNHLRQLLKGQQENDEENVEEAIAKEKEVEGTHGSLRFQ